MISILLKKQQEKQKHPESWEPTREANSWQLTTYVRADAPACGSLASECSRALPPRVVCLSLVWPPLTSRSVGRSSYGEDWSLGPTGPIYEEASGGPWRGLRTAWWRETRVGGLLALEQSRKAGWISQSLRESAVPVENCLLSFWKSPSTPPTQPSTLFREQLLFLSGAFVGSAGNKGNLCAEGRCSASASAENRQRLEVLRQRRWGLVQRSCQAVSSPKVDFFRMTPGHLALCSCFSLARWEEWSVITSKMAGMCLMKSPEGKQSLWNIQAASFLCFSFEIKPIMKVDFSHLLPVFLFHWQWISSPVVISLKLISEVIFNQLDADEITCFLLVSLALLLLAAVCGVDSMGSGGFVCPLAFSLLHPQGSVSGASVPPWAWLPSPTSPPHLLSTACPCPAYFAVACISLKTKKELFPSFMSSSRELMLTSLRAVRNLWE